MHCRNFGMCSLALGALLLVAPSWFIASAAPRQEQQQSQPPPPPPPSPTPPPSSQPASDPAPLIGPLPLKRRKVWTNDEVIQLRTPVDNYVAEKEAREAAEAEAAAKVAAKAKLVDEAGSTEKLPATVEETRKLIAAKESQIADDQQALDRYTAELPNEPAERKDRMQGEISRITARLPKERSELKVLQDQVEKLTKMQPKEATAPPPLPPSQ
jgi:hypothetical protein